eukprot:COSAG03_NODE_5456_length_1247_cov_1.021777_1_plen_44_part_01
MGSGVELYPKPERAARRQNGARLGGTLRRKKLRSFPLPRPKKLE